jgi:hypothetical protein
MTLDTQAGTRHERSSSHPLAPTATGIVDELVAFCTGRDRVSVGEVVDRLGQAGFPVLVFVLVLPPLIPIPGPYGMVFGSVVAILAIQMIVGQSRPWLPALLTRRALNTGMLIKSSGRVRAWLACIEEFHAPGRIEGFTGHRMTCIAGCVILPLSIMIGLPIPFGNLPPVLAIAMITLALIMRDGLALIIAYIVAALAAAWVGGLLWFGRELVERIWWA